MRFPSLTPVLRRALLPSSFIFVIVAVCAGCGSGGHSGGPGSISVAVTPQRGALTVSQTLNVSATVTNDVSAAGVTWSASAGSFSGQTTTSATYTAPPSASTAGPYAITATSVADPSKSASISVAVTDLAGVSTYHNDLARDGANIQEYALTPSAVKSATFGKLFSCAVDGAVYAQPLWLANVIVGGTNRNVIFVATQHDSMYAFDADANPCVTLWHANLLDASHGAGINETSAISPSSQIGKGNGDIAPEVGITGTPVIDTSSGTLYVVSKSVNASSQFSQRLHALDITTGGEKFSGPVLIAASVPGTGDGSVNGVVSFNAQTENQRAGLALVNGVVYIAWAAHEDADPYHGWVIGCNATALAQVTGAVFNTTPNQVGSVTYSRGGIWMGGGAPAVDAANNLYVTTGNGTFDGITNFGDSVLRLSSSAGLALADWFTPYNQAQLDMSDTDLGSGAAVVLLDAPSAPHPHMLIGGGKDGLLYLLDRDSMGHTNTSDNSQIVQTLTVTDGSFSTPALWQTHLYYAGAGGHAKAYSFNANTGLFDSAPASQSTALFGFPGATISVSANGSSNGIVWLIDSSQYCTPQSPGCGPAVLHAYDATNLENELWNSSLVASDKAANAVKFTVPTIANGKLYIGTRGNDCSTSCPNTTPTTPGELDIYGLKPN